MTERTLILLVVMLAIVAGGALSRLLAARRREQTIATVHLDPTDSGLPRILSFYGPSCEACDRQKTVLQEMERDERGSFSIELRDAAQDYAFASQFGFVMVPTTIVIAGNGQIREINSGFVPRDILEDQLRQAA